MIENIHMKNFRRFSNSSFDLKEGITFIEGENNAGKTSIFIAIEYALFGVVSGFNTQAALFQPGKSEMGVQLRYKGKDNFSYILQRMHKLKKRGKSKSATGHFTLKQITNSGDEKYIYSSDFPNNTEEQLQLKINETLGISKRLFEVAVNIKQGQISQILEGSANLDIVLGVSAASASEKQFRANALNFEKETNQINTLQASLDALLNERDELDKQSAHLKEKLNESNKELLKLQVEKNNFEELNKLINPLTEAVEFNENSLSTWKQEINVLKTQQSNYDKIIKEFGPEIEINKTIDDVKANIKKLELIINENKQNEKVITDKISNIDQSIGDISGKIKRRNDLPDGEIANCENCGAPIDREKVKKELKDWTEEIEKIQLSKNEKNKELDKIKELINETMKEKNNNTNKLTSLEMQLKQIKSIKNQIKEILAKIKETEEAEKSLSKTLKNVIVEYETNIKKWYDKNSIDLNEKLLIGKIDGLKINSEKIGDFTVNDEVLMDIEYIKLVNDKLTKIYETFKIHTSEISIRYSSINKRQKELQEMMNNLKPRINKISTEIVSIESSINKLLRKKKAAEKLRLLAKGFKELQGNLREHASVELAKKTHQFHKNLSKLDEYLKLRVDANKYITYVTPKDINEEVPAHNYQGGGHKLLLGLAFKLAIASFVANPSFILLDEPTYGLHPKNKNELFNNIGSVVSSKQLLFITHQLDNNADVRVLKVVKRENISEVIL